MTKYAEFIVSILLLIGIWAISFRSESVKLDIEKEIHSCLSEGCIHHNKTDSQNILSKNIYNKAWEEGLAYLPNGKFKRQFLTLDLKVKEKLWNRIQASPLIINNHESLLIFPNGELAYVCKMLKKNKPLFARPFASRSVASSYTTSVSINNPPALNSRPASSNTIFLDFNGEVISETWWNVSEGVSSWDCRPFSRDADETTFSASEQQEIEDIWNEVVDDFAGYDVNITTIEPTSPYFYHALITPGTDRNGVNCPHWNAGGIAYLGYSYLRITDVPLSTILGASPAWVKSDWWYNTSDIAVIISHEIGHNLSLNHDGTSTRSYYAGHSGGGVPSWGPIMGDPYDKNLTQWSKGDYYDAITEDTPGGEDDLAVIDFHFGNITDDHSDNISLATTLADNTISGVLESAIDIDTFKFSVNTEQLVTINLDPYMNASYGNTISSWGGNVDLSLIIYNGEGGVVAQTEYENTTRASFENTLAPGDYYISVLIDDNVGDPQSASPSGYANYGSRGSYNLSISELLSVSDSDSDGLPDNWEISYFSDISKGADDDSDADGSSNLDEYIAGTDPSDSSSTFKITEFFVQPNDSRVLRWDPVNVNREYQINLSDNLKAGAYSNISSIAYPANSYTDSVNRVGSESYFYRLEVIKTD